MVNTDGFFYEFQNLWRLRSECAPLFCLISAILVGQTGMAVEKSPIFERTAPPILASEYHTPYTEGFKEVARLDVVLNGNKRRYYVYPPNAMDGTKPRPAILLLHGAKRTGLSMIDMWDEVAKRHDLILIAPDGINQGWGFEDSGPDYISALLADIEKKFPIDQKKIYLFGHSAGGIFPIYMGLIKANAFAAVGLRAGKFANPDHFELAASAQR